MRSKLVALFLCFLLVMNLIFFATGKISETIFWIVTGIAAVFAYKLIPMMRKN